MGLQNSIRPLAFLLPCLFLVSCGYGPPATFKHSEPPAGSLELLRSVCAAESRATRQARPETVISESGQRDVEVVHDGEKQVVHTNFAVGTECLNRNLRDIWGSLHNPSGVQWDDSTIQTLEQSELIGDEVFHLSAFQSANPWPHPTWYIDWSHRLLRGTLNQPEQVQVVFQKTTGTSFIKHWWGQLVFEQQGDCTAAYMAIELKGSRISVDTCRSAITTQFNRLLTAAPEFKNFPL